MERNIILFALQFLLIIHTQSAGLLAQGSPDPILLNFAATTLPDTLAADSAFCKGGMLVMHGQHFLSAAGGESWDATRVFFGGLTGVAGNVISLSTAQNGQNDTIRVQIPDIFPADTCLTLTFVKTTTLASFNYTYTMSDTVCLVGDYAEVVYSDTLYCTSDQNPIPQIVLGPNTSGAFCCKSGPPGFVVLANGEVPLYNGSSGIDNRFEFRTTHPVCAETLAFEIDIIAATQSVALYNGQNQLPLCTNSPGYPVADSATLVPAVGLGHFADPTGNILVLDSLRGRISPAGSQTGIHNLLYIPQLRCYDTAVVEVTVTAPATAQVTYPSLGVPPLLCPGDPVAVPGFITGSPGGTFWSDPVGVSFGQLGQIDPATSQPGTYDLYYRPAGSCADTAQTVAGLVIDTASASNLGNPAGTFCLDDTISFGPLPPGWCGVFLNDSALYTGPNAVLPLSGSNGLGLVGGEIITLGYRAALPCADTAWHTVLVIPCDIADVSYPNPAYCTGDPDPFPVNLGTGGGLFSAITLSTVVDSVNGRLDIDLSGPGIHEIVYTTPGTCPASDTMTVEIFPSASAEFSYPAGDFCQNETDPMPTIVGAPGGSFTADSGLVIDPVSGLIDLLQSDTGTFNVTYSLSGGCQTSFSQTVRVVDVDSLSAITFAEPYYCTEGDDPTPLIVGGSSGTFIGSTGLAFAVRDRGQIDLSASGPGSYIVTLDLHNRCAFDPTDTISILEMDDPYFSYSQTEVCAGGAPLLLDSVSVFGGVFSCASSTLVFADSLGTIYLAATQAGQYVVEHHTAGACQDSAVVSLTVNPQPAGDSLATFPPPPVCRGDQMTLRAVASGVNSYQWRVNTDSAAGTFDLLQRDDLQNGDSVSCVLSNSFGCADTLNRIAEIAPMPSWSLSKRPFKISRGEDIEIDLTTDVPYTFYHWAITDSMNVSPSQNSGSTAQLVPGLDLPLVIPVDLVDRMNPGEVVVSLTPRSGNCLGREDTIRVQVLPSDLPILIPGFLSPNGDGHNDTWLITWQEDIDYEQYEVHLYNRSGGRVAHLRPLQREWDPGRLPDGVYWYKVNRIGEKDALLAGGLTIKRNN
ncbi:MAG: gliding motility-associated C-terminal domain-containing protein [Bacteroidota bacterium]